MVENWGKKEAKNHHGENVHGRKPSQLIPISQVLFLLFFLV
jgi:hypothetical protein